MPVAVVREKIIAMCGELSMMRAALEAHTLRGGGVEAERGIGERDRVLEELRTQPHVYVALHAGTDAPCAVCEGLKADFRHVIGRAREGENT